MTYILWKSDNDLSLPSLMTSSPLRPQQWGYWRVMLVLVYKPNWAEKTEAREYSHCLLSIIFCLKVNCFTLKLKAKAKHQNEKDREGRFLFQTFPVGSFLITKYWHFNLNKIITSRRWVNLLHAVHNHTFLSSKGEKFQLFIINQVHKYSCISFSLVNQGSFIFKEPIHSLIKQKNEQTPLNAEYHLHNIIQLHEDQPCELSPPYLRGKKLLKGLKGHYFVIPQTGSLTQQHKFKSCQLRKLKQEIRPELLNHQY